MTLDQEVRQLVRSRVRTGLSVSDEILTTVREVLSADYDPAAVEESGHRILMEELQLFAEEQRSWPRYTDCDRLDEAFGRLDEAGIVARLHFSCCGNCGVAEIGDDIDRAVASGRAIRGYTSFHQQDTASAAEGHGLYLSYGPVAAGADEALAIGREFVEALQAAGLETVWGDDLAKRVYVRLKWQRRQANRINLAGAR